MSRISIASPFNAECGTALCQLPPPGCWGQRKAREARLQIGIVARRQHRFFSSLFLFSSFFRPTNSLTTEYGGVFILGFFFVFFFFFPSLLASWLFGFLASWLLGFLASWLLGFLAFRLLGFLASRLLGFWASWLLGFLASWLLGFLAFRLLGFSASGLLGFSAFCWFMRLLVAFWLFASFAFPVPLRQVAFFRHHGGGCRPPPTPPLRFRFSAEI